MAKKIKGQDKINDTTLHELLLMMDAKLNHIEDISADNRAIIVKLPKDKIEELKELFDDFKSRKDELKEFEKELKKHKDKLTPGQVGES